MHKPDVHDYKNPVSYMRDQLEYLKKTERGYSIRKACLKLVRCSPSLISNILAGKRNITEDRLNDLSKVMRLSALEKEAFRGLAFGHTEKPKIASPVRRKRSSSSLLNDWINPFVKDAMRLSSVRENIQNLYKELSALATRKRIDRSLSFLLANGYLVKNQNGQLEEATPVNVLGDEEMDRKIRHFHKQTLELAKRGIETFELEERLAQAMILRLNPESHEQLKQKIHEFSLELQAFSEAHAADDQRLYQLILHLTPTGGDK